MPPDLYGTVIQQISAMGLAPKEPDGEPRARVIIEKPFGTDLQTARELNRKVHEALDENQVYRIDHYLGKETVQNIMVFRFANSVFEPIWNRRYVDHVQITAAETVGVENRGGYYDKAGVVRDMFQNHLLQLLCLTAMEPPVGFSADAVRDEKGKLLRSVRPVAPEQRGFEMAVRGQYGAGKIGGKEGVALSPGNRRGARILPRSPMRRSNFSSTIGAGRACRFICARAKHLAKRVTEIAIQFKRPPLLYVQRVLRGGGRRQRPMCW